MNRTALPTRLARRSLLACAALVLATGSACDSGLPPLEEVSGKVLYANDGWTDRDRTIYYYTPQGTELHGLRYSWFVNLNMPFSDERLADRDRMQRFGFLHDPDKPDGVNVADLPIGFTHHEDPEGGSAYLDISCAACHTGELHYRGTAIRIDGGQAMHAVASTELGQFAPSLVLALANTYLNPFEFDRFAKRVLGVQYPEGKPELREGVRDTLGKFIREAWHGRNLYPTADGYGRIDALGHIANAVFGDELDPRNYRTANAPVSYPHVWDIWKFDWVQWNGSVAQPMGRNIGEALGVKATVELVGSEGQALPDDLMFESSVLPLELHCIESTLQHLSPPHWQDPLPPIDGEKAERGSKLFRRHCQGCHGPHLYKNRAKQATPDKPVEWRMKMIDTAMIGTDPLTAGNFYRYRYDASAVDTSNPALAEIAAGDALDAVTRAVSARKYDTLALDDEQRAEYDGFGRESQVRALEAYKARPLHGVWATPPFLHNGSVPTIYDLLRPEEDRPEKFWVGTRRYDPVNLGYETGEIENGFVFDTTIEGNANTGHQFRNDGGVGVIGRLLTDTERYEIIEFLKAYGHPCHDFPDLLTGDNGNGPPPINCEAPDGTDVTIQGPASLPDYVFPESKPRKPFACEEAAGTDVTSRVPATQPDDVEGKS